MKNSILKIKYVLMLTILVFATSCGNDDDPAPIINEATSIEVSGGNNQTGFAGNELPNPIEVLVKDQDGNPFSGATVTFSVTEGAVSSPSAGTNSEGIATVNWTLGETVGIQTLTVSSFIDGTALGGSPLSISVTSLNPCMSQTNSTVLPIPNDNPTGAITIITITDSFIVADVNVTINIDHPFTADLDIFLVSPTGAVSIILSDDNGGSNNNYTNTIFDDDADISITDGTAPFTGSFIPETSLSSFNGIDSAGDWKLLVIDDNGIPTGGSGVTGEILNWTLELCR